MLQHVSLFFLISLLLPSLSADEGERPRTEANTKKKDPPITAIAVRPEGGEILIGSQLGLRELSRKTLVPRRSLETDLQKGPISPH